VAALASRLSPPWQTTFCIRYPSGHRSSPVSQKKIGNLGVRPRAGDRRYACQMTRVLLLIACGYLAVVVLTTYRRSWHCCLAWAGAYRPALDTTLTLSARLPAAHGCCWQASCGWCVATGAVDAPQPARSSPRRRGDRIGRGCLPVRARLETAGSLRQLPLIGMSSLRLMASAKVTRPMSTTCS
jgi:hypothetical protein